MKKLWEKNGTQHETAEAYCFGDTAVLDSKLIVYDVLGSIAHANMLSAIGLLTEKEFLKLKKALKDILELASQGKFTVEFGDEDVHTKIENYLTETLGDVGKKIHTGRSRNDQVLVDLRLYTKDYAFQIAFITLELIGKFFMFAKKYEFVPMPGYTHMQKAMPSSVGMWAGSFAESLLDDLEILKAAFALNDQNPLGSGAAYGVPLPIQRDVTSKLLGFAKTQNNALYCQASRGKGQLAIMSALTQIMLTISRFAQDVLLFTTSEFQFFTVAADLWTGASIMPQKKNLDVMEIVRARTHVVVSYEQMAASIISGLPSGYNADFGETKMPFMNAMETVIDTLKIMNLVVDSLSPNVRTLKEATTKELFAAHAAYVLVKQGMPFREAYQKIGMTLHTLPIFDVAEVLASTSHSGGPGNLGLSKASAEMKKKKAWWQKKEARHKACINQLKGGETT